MVDHMEEAKSRLADPVPSTAVLQAAQVHAILALVEELKLHRQSRPSTPFMGAGWSGRVPLEAGRW